MNRQSGSLLVEMMVALALLTVGLLGFFTMFTSNLKSGQEVIDRDEVRVALEDTVELLRSSAFANLYADYSGATMEVPYLEGPDYYTPATCQVTCFVNETTLPAEFGPVLDIDGGGGLTSTDCSTTYKLLPVRLTLSYGASFGPVTRALFVVIGDKV